MDPKKEAERLIKEVEAEEGVTLDAEFREKLLSKLLLHCATPAKDQKTISAKLQKSNCETIKQYHSKSLKQQTKRKTSIVSSLCMNIFHTSVVFHSYRYHTLHFQQSQKNLSSSATTL